MQVHPFVQGSPEWRAHRTKHFNASDAPAMMGCSPYKTRSQLLRELATGLGEEVTADKQRLFDGGHRSEALAKPLAEKIIGEDLYRVTGSDDDLSASLDGLTMGEEKVWEHKSLNEELRAAIPILSEGCANSWQIGAMLPLMYRVQMEQQLLVTGANEALFTASKWTDDGVLVEARHCWYRSDPALREKIVAGWKQFAADLAAYAPTEAAPIVVAQAVENLPVVMVRLDGQLEVQSNLPMFGAALKAFVAKIPVKPATDQEFADTDAACKALKKAEDALEAAETNAMAGIANVEAMRRMVADFRDLARTARLASEKMVKARKEQIREEECRRGRQAVDEHIQALNARLGQRLMPMLAFNFPEAIKGLKTIDSVRNAIDTEIARVKIEANSLADRIDVNLKAMAEAGAPSLFPDAPSLVLKAADDLAAIIAQRLAVEQRRVEVERERIRVEESARIKREQIAARDREERAEAQHAYERLLAATPEQSAVVAHTPPGTHSAPAASPMLPDAVVYFDRPILPPTLKTGDIGARLGFALHSAFIRGPLGIEASGVSKQGSPLWRESDWPLICSALAEHVLKVGEVRK